MRRIQKITGWILIFFMMMTILPPVNVTVYAEAPTVTEISIGKTFDSDKNFKESYLTIKGSGLKDLDVGFEISGKLVFLDKRDINTDGVLQFIVDPNQLGDKLYIENWDTIEVGISQMPVLTGITPAQIENGNGTLTITGQNFGNIGSVGGTTITAKYGKGIDLVTIQDTEIDAANNKITVPNPTGTPGLNDVIFESFKTVGTTGVHIYYTYSDIFRLYDKLNVADDIKMFPNRGVKGSNFYFQQIPEMQNVDIFFLKTLDGTDHFSNSNKVTHEKPVKLKDENGNDYYKLSATVPDLPVGEYFVVLTNVIAAGVDPQVGVNSEYVMGEKFTIINGTNALDISTISPNEGPDIGSLAEITGSNIGDLNIENLTPGIGNPTVYLDPESEKKLVVEYPDGTYKIGGNDIDVSIKKKILVIIGQDTEFAEDDSGNFIYDFNNLVNRITVIPKSGNVYEETVKDVVIQTETILQASDGTEYRFTEEAILKDGYTFIPSSRVPEIESVSPDKVQIEEDGGSYRIKQDTLVSITGNNFMIYRDVDASGNPIVRYPIIKFKDNDKTEIEINKNENKVKDKSGNAVLDDNNNPVIPEVTILDKNGNVLDGSDGKQLGTRIIIIIPKGTEVSEPLPNPAPRDIEIINPIKNSPGNGFSTVVQDVVDFVITNNTPVIESVTPNVVTVDGGENITIQGSNFQEGVKVFIDGAQVQSITRAGDGKTVTFKAPAGREGETQLQVMNPSGGTAVYPFIYVKTYTSPVITSFSPNKGSNGTLVLINGDNFLKPDPTVPDTTGMNIYKIIGTRILLDGKDINTYYKPDNIKIDLQDYANGNNHLIVNNNGKIELSDYYHSVILQEENQNHYYTLNIDAKGNIVLSDGANDKYTIRPDGTSNIKAVKETVAEYPLTVEDDGIIVNGKTLKMKTPYTVEDGVITGNKVKVLSKNQIIFTVPQLEVEKWYDLTVINPDTKRDEKLGEKGFYYFKQPKRNPEITNIVPNQGSTDGGYTIVIAGAGFEDNGVDKSKVYIGGVEVPASDTIVSTDGTSITVKVPKYPGDLKKEIETDRKTVPVVIINSDGGNASKEDGFTYIIPTSHPKINKITPQKGNAAGGEVVQIWGADFRYFEPYTDTNGNAQWDPGEPFQNLNGNKDQNGNDIWDDLSNQDVYNSLKGDYQNNIKPILPKVYFGNYQAQIIDFADGYLSVEIPTASEGKVDVYIVNNDYGLSNKMPFTYEASKPGIDKIIPAVGKKQGKDKIEIHGTQFVQSDIVIYDQEANGVLTRSSQDTSKLTLVQFGDPNDVNISNRSIEPLQLNAGSIINGVTTVTLGDLTVKYNATGTDKTVTFTIKKSDKTYSGTIEQYDDNKVYIPLYLLKTEDTKESYSGYELVKLEVQHIERRLLVDRGFAPQVEYISPAQIVVHTPSYYTIGKVPLTVINPDGGKADGEFEYKNPDSSPTITNITRDGKYPVEETINEEQVKVLKLSNKGGNIVSIIGTDFRENAVIKIGNVQEIGEKDILYELPAKLTFTMPAVPEKEVGKLHRVVVVNEDGGTASSDEVNPLPIYIMFTKGESNPAIEKITPDKGPSSGGMKIKIEGKDFRQTMSGFTGTLAVYFGDMQVPESDVTVVDSKTIYIITPSHAPGEVTVKVENPDGTLSDPTATYTYLSNPKIIAVVDPTDPEEKNRIHSISVEGGQEIKLKGAGYQEGAKVVFNPVIKKIEDTDTAAGQVIYINGEAYTLEEGTDGTEVKFIDSETLTVKTPQGKMDTTGIIVINPDGGASDIYEDIRYSLPEIQAPAGKVYAELVYDRYIKVNWSAVVGAREYEIYVVENDRETELIGSTTLTSYLYEDLEPRTTYKFIIKAVGEFNISKPSQESNSVRTGSRVGPPDDDGELNDRTIMEKVGNQANIIIGKDSYHKALTIDLTRGTLAGSKEVVVSMSASIISNYRAENIKIIGKDFMIQFNPNAFNISKVEENRSRADAGVRFKIVPYSGSAELKGGETALSSQYSLEANVFVGKESTAIDYLASDIEIALDFDAARADMRRLQNISLNRYNGYRQTWQPIKDRNNGYDVSIRDFVDRLGRYMVIGRRK